MRNKKYSLLPQIKKDVKEFLTKEEGKITAKGIIKGAVFVSALGIAAEVAAHGSHANHVSHNNVDTNYLHNSGTPLTGSHGSYNDHDSHGSHGSHGSHASW